ncbi:hypothetical protein EJB05_37659, partial [Eragrostis curvula]
MRGLCSCARALVLAAAVLVVSSYVADGVRTTPSASGLADADRLDGAEPSIANRGTSSGYNYKPAEDEMLLASRRQRAASGSRLPDCAHACGACSPCRRVMVSFRCAESASESCPIAYRCMCRGRFFHVPSL